MSAVNTVEEPTEEEKRNKLYKLTKPIRSITFPLGCIIFGVVYWLIIIPIAYHLLDTHCIIPTMWEVGNCSEHWNFLFWGFAPTAFVAILGIAICYRGCHPPKDKEKEARKAAMRDAEKQKENEKLLSDQVKYNNLKNHNLTGLSLKNEKRSPSREKETNQNNFNTNTTKEDKIEKKVVTLPIRKSIVLKETENKPVDDVKVKTEAARHPTAPKDETIMEEIDKIFPRCSTRRKANAKKRPDTLIIHSPKYPKEEHEVKRYSAQERPGTQSPLTPREMFFHDLIQGARRQTVESTEIFLDNERRDCSGNYTPSSKPEVKSFVLKERTSTEASSPEYFIASVPNRRSCTAEAFLFVDGGQSEEALKICYIDKDDEVFKSD